MGGSKSLTWAFVRQRTTTFMVVLARAGAPRGTSSTLALLGKSPIRRAGTKQQGDCEHRR
jgi:hypothetical protein